MPDSIELVTGGLFSSEGVGKVSEGLLGSGASSGLHPLTRIRNYIVTVLRTAAMVDPSRIHSERVEPVVAFERKWKLPAINVTAQEEEDPEIDAESPRTYKRRATVEIDIIDGGRDVETKLENIARVVESVLVPYRFLGGNADDVVLGPAPAVFGGEGVSKIGAKRLFLFVTFRDEFSEEAGDALKKVHVNWDLGPEPDGQIEAEDELELEGS